VVRPDCHEYLGRVENCLRRVPERYFYQIQAKSKPGKEIGAPELNKHNSKENRYSVKVCKEGPWVWRKPIGLTGRESIGLFK
jgi:hypothetical protein